MTNMIPMNSRLIRLLTRAALLSAGLAVTALACGWYGGAGEGSVRFNYDAKSKGYFGLLPPLSKSFIIERSRHIAEWGYDDLWGCAKELVEPVNKLWDDAQEAEGNGDLSAARKLLRQYRERTEHPRETLRLDNEQNFYYEPLEAEDRQKRRNSAQDQLDAMSALDHGTPTDTVLDYLDARDDYDADAPAEEVSKALDAIGGDANLRDNVHYLRAALSYRAGKYEEAGDGFEALARRYRNSEKREAALYMAALAALKQSKVYQAPYARNPKDREQPRTKKDEAWYSSRDGFQEVMHEYPRGRYFNDARGWLAYLSYRAGDWPDAMVEYYRMLGDASDLSARLEATFSLYLIRTHVTEPEMRQVEDRLAGEPAAALAYAYHEMYNYSTGYCDDPWESDRTESDLGIRNKEARSRIAEFANRLANRAGVNALFVLRAAMADLQADDYAAASRLAKRAVQAGLTGEQRAQALWVQGVADHLRGEYAAARDAIKRVIAEKPSSNLLERAERYLPIILEDMGDIEGALDRYIALGYNVDAAYFVDVLMTPEQLAHFIAGRPMSPKRDELLYALGVRYLRDRRWTDARQTLAKVRTTGRGVDYDYNHRYDNYDTPEPPKQLTLKEDDSDPAIPGIRPQWVEQDLRTADDLERLELEAERAEGDEAKAEALYQLASYQYQGNLRFHNPAAWGWARHDYLYLLDDRGLYRQPDEAQLLFRNIQSHDAASRSLEFFLDVVRRFPRTRAARDAMYTAAVCHERLSSYNDYWRAVYSRGGYAGSRLVTYKDVKAAYPDYQLPRGTDGWEPATRTVNGGPGWQPPPKPVRRPPRWKRITAALAVALLQVHERFNKAVVQVVHLCEYWCWLQIEGFLILTAAFGWYSGLKAKRRLLAEMGECGVWPRALLGPAAQEIASRPLMERYREFLTSDVRDRAIGAIRRSLQNSSWLLLRTKAGPILVTNFMLYGSAVVFLVMLLRVMV